MSKDLNDARVEALMLATSWGASTEQFNKLWSIIVPAAIEHGKKLAP